MHNRRENLLEGDIGPHLKRLSIPMMWGITAVSTFGLVDTFYISRLGTSALAALGFTMPTVLFFMGIIFGLMVSTTSVLSRAYGEGNFAKVQRLATDSLVLTVLMVLSASSLGYLLIDHVFQAMGATNDIMPLIHRFMTIWYCGMIFMGITFICNACIRASGNTRMASSLMITASVLNICIDPFLIYGWGPFPEMGFAGAAMTLVISYMITSCLALYFLIVKKDLFCPQLFHAGTVDSWRRLLHVGIPSMFANLIAPISAAIVTWMAASLGHEAVAALGVATRIESMAVMIFYAMGAGVSIFTGQNFGAGNYGRVTEATALAIRYALMWGILIAGILWTFADMIPPLFDKSQAVISYTAQYLRMVPVSYGALGITIVSNAALNAMGKPLPATLIILMRTIVIYVPLAYIAEKYYGFLGIMLALVFTNFTVGVISHLWNKAVTP